MGQKSKTSFDNILIIISSINNQREKKNFFEEFKEPEQWIKKGKFLTHKKLDAACGKIHLKKCRARGEKKTCEKGRGK